jgi:hypothetical protein
MKTNHTLKMAVAALALSAATQTLEAQVYISNVISFSQGTMADAVSPVMAIRSDLTKTYGAPENNDTQGPENFYSLGFGGEITVEMSGPICNGAGDDLTVFETTWGYNCSTYPEKARVWASQDLCNWVELTTEANPLCHNGSLDLACLPWAKYLKIRDVSDITLFTIDADGYDVDGISGNSTGCSFPAQTGLSRYAANGFLGNPQTTQGLTENNAPIPVARDNQNKMLGLPVNPFNIYANDVTTSPANNNFFSLGKGGSVILTFPYSLNNGPGADVQVFETSFNDVASRTCGNYPEKARVQGSCDGVTFYDLVILPGDAGNGEVAGTNVICRDGKLDFGSLTVVNYIKITDITFIGVGNFPGDGDGFDVDAVLGLQNCQSSVAKITNEESNSEIMEDAMLVEAYPNPASDFMSVSVRMNMADNVTFRVMDLTGRVLTTETINTNGDNFNYVLNLNNYKTGIYLLSVEGNGARQVLKIVKQ